MPTLIPGKVHSMKGLPKLRPSVISGAVRPMDTVRGVLGRRRNQFLLGTSVLTVALAANWSWLSAVGVAPLIVGVLPCLLMCALGLCMGGSGRRSCEGEAATPGTPFPQTAEQPGATKILAQDASPTTPHPRLERARQEPVPPSPRKLEPQSPTDPVVPSDRRPGN